MDQLGSTGPLQQHKGKGGISRPSSSYKGGPQPPTRRKFDEGSKHGPQTPTRRKSNEGSSSSHTGEPQPQTRRKTAFFTWIAIVASTIISSMLLRYWCGQYQCRPLAEDSEEESRPNTKKRKSVPEGKTATSKSLSLCLPRRWAPT